MVRRLTILLASIVLLRIHSYSQSVTLIKTSDGSGKKFWVLTIDIGDHAPKRYWPSCFFSHVASLADTVKIRLIKDLLTQMDDTTLCYRPVTRLSHRFSGGSNSSPQSKQYNVQIAALMLINYLVFNSQAIEYAPFPVLYDTVSGREISTACPALDSIIEDYKGWFLGIERNGFVNYSFPIKNGRYQWFATLYYRNRTFAKMPPWEKYHDCPVLERVPD